MMALPSKTLLADRSVQNITSSWNTVSDIQEESEGSRLPSVLAVKPDQTHSIVWTCISDSLRLYTSPKLWPNVRQTCHAWNT
jgi:hypothetical protein